MGQLGGYQSSQEQAAHLPEGLRWGRAATITTRYTPEPSQVLGADVDRTSLCPGAPHILCVRPSGLQQAPHPDSVSVQTFGQCHIYSTCRSELAPWPKNEIWDI